MDKESFSKVISLKIPGTWPSNSDLYDLHVGKVSSNGSLTSAEVDLMSPLLS